MRVSFTATINSFLFSRASKILPAPYVRSVRCGKDKTRRTSVADHEAGVAYILSQRGFERIDVDIDSVRSNTGCFAAAVLDDYLLVSTPFSNLILKCDMCNKRSQGGREDKHQETRAIRRDVQETRTQLSPRSQRLPCVWICNSLSVIRDDHEL